METHSKEGVRLQRWWRSMCFACWCCRRYTDEYACIYRERTRCCYWNKMILHLWDDRVSAVQHAAHDNDDDKYSWQHLHVVCTDVTSAHAHSWFRNWPATPLFKKNCPETITIAWKHRYICSGRLGCRSTLYIMEPDLAITTHSWRSICAELQFRVVLRKLVARWQSGAWCIAIRGKRCVINTVSTSDLYTQTNYCHR